MRNKIDPTTATFAIFSILYPLITVAAVGMFGVGAALAVLLVMLTARLLLPVLRGVPMSLGLVLLPVLVAVLAVSLFNGELSVRLYPVFVNLAMLASFAVTLWQPPSMIERFARVVEPNLPERGVIYAYRVTIVWIAFFAVNGTIALWSVLQPGWTIWTVYNGFIAYVAAGLLFGIEYIVRQRVMQRPGP